MALLPSGAWMCSGRGLKCERHFPWTIKCLSVASMKLSSFGNSQWNLFPSCMKFFFCLKKTSLHLFFHLTYFHDGVFCFIFPKSGDTSVLIVG